MKVLAIKFDGNTSRASSTDAWGQTDGHGEGNGAALDYVNAPKD
jgi:hypothetical protein